MANDQTHIKAASSVLPSHLYYVITSSGLSEEEANDIELSAGVENTGTGRTFDLAAADLTVICGDPDAVSATDQALLQAIKELGTAIWATTDFREMRLVHPGIHA